MLSSLSIRFTSLVLACLLAFTASAQQVKTFSGDPLKVKHFTLANGFEVYLTENDQAPEIYGGVVIKAGGKTDPKEATGMAHYLEHMLFKGTKTLGTTDYAAEKVYLDKIDSLYEQLGKTTDDEARLALQLQINENNLKAAEYAIPNEFDDMLAAIGGKNINAYTSEERTVYYNSFPPHQLEKWLAVYSHRFQQPVFRLFQSELEAVYEEKNRAMDNFVYSLFKTFNENFYKNHPYGQQDILGLTEHLKNPSLNTMYKYFETYYVANNMALVLSGNFKAEEVMPFIKREFERLPNKPVPAYPKYEEKPFNGREVVKIRVTPVKINMLGWRTVPIGHPDQPALELLAYILNNNNETGLMDKLRKDGKLLAAQGIPNFYNDHGGFNMLVVPKVVGQSPKKAEALVLEALEKVKKGDFSDTMFVAAKNAVTQDRQREFENNRDRGEFIVQAFGSTMPYDKFLKHSLSIAEMSKADVMNVANKYFGPNYLAVESRMGFPKKDKLPKPPFKAVEARSDGAKSDYRQSWDQLPEGDLSIPTIDFNGDVVFNEYPEMGQKLYFNQNPMNELFSLRLEFEIGTNTDLKLEPLAHYLDRVGSKTRSNSQIKSEFDYMGINYSFISQPNKFVIVMDGYERDLEKGLTLLTDLWNNPELTEKPIKDFAQDIKAERKIERKEAQNLGSALLSYSRYGYNSDGLRRLTMKDIKELNAGILAQSLARVRNATVITHYVGGKRPKEVEAMLQNTILGKGQRTKNPEIHFTPNVPTANTIYFLDKKDASQSQIYFWLEGNKFNKNEVAELTAFNEYFGGDMSSLVFQEIRELRSLAYSTYGNYRQPELPEKKNTLVCFVGSQADKSQEAVEVMMGLINDMPIKQERAEKLQKALVQKRATSRPSFRNMSATIDSYKRMGFNEDPTPQMIDAFNSFDMSLIEGFYGDHIKGKPVTITIVGNAKKVKPENLSKFGTVKTVKIKDILKD